MPRQELCHIVNLVVHIIVHTGVLVKPRRPLHIAGLGLKTFDSVVEGVALSLGEGAPLDVYNWILANTGTLLRWYCRNQDSRESEESSSKELHSEVLRCEERIWDKQEKRVT
jgi:hypothetical protein